MKKIGVLFKSFFGWQGGIDFLKSLIIAMKYLESKKKIEVYVCFYKAIPMNFKQEFDSDLKVILYNTIQQIHTQYKLDILFPSMEVIPTSISNNWIGYLPDCQHKYYPEFFSSNEIFQRDEHFSSMVKNAQKIIVNSQDTKKDLIYFFGATEDQIHALPFAPMLDDIGYLVDQKDLLKKYNLPENFFMISNQFWIHKSHLTAFEAIALLGNVDIHIVCTGLKADYRDSEYMQKLYLKIDSLGIKKQVHFLGLIPKRDQIEMMKRALAVIQPTLFEGGPGGGSVYNALSIGKRCIVSNISVNQEIQSDLVTFFEAGSSYDLALKMSKLLTQKSKEINDITLLEISEYYLDTLASSIMEVISSFPYNKELYDHVMARTKALEFTRAVNSLINQIEQIRSNVIVYGNGTISKIISMAMQNNIIAFVDQTSELISKEIIKGEVYNPQNLVNMDYDKIIISVLGREDEIEKYLVETLHVEKEKIIRIVL